MSGGATEIERAVLVRGLYRSGFDPDRLDEFVAPECVDRGPEGETEGIEALREKCRELHRALPDLRFSVDALRVDGEEVEVRWTLTGTHRGEIRGTGPTGRPVEMSGRHTEVVRDGRIVERYGSADGESVAGRLAEGPQGTGSERRGREEDRGR